MNKKTFQLITLAFTFSFLFSGCAKYNAAFIKQGYHDLTSRYNGNFNAKQKYKLTIKSIEESRLENYDELLPLYAFGTLEDTKSKESEFNIVVEKASTAVQLHQISNWSDDNFLLLGKSFFMKGDYPKAIESLRYITANYKDGVDGRSDKKKKKHRKSKKRKARAKKQAKKDVAKLKAGKDIRPKKGFMKHSPAKSEALVWLVNSFAANEQLNEAQAVLDYISLDNSFIQNYDREKSLAHANYLIKQNLFTEAIPHIETAIEGYKSNKKKARYRYILAQLYQKVGNNSRASYFYTESAKGNANYDMVFNAKLNTLKLSSGNKDTDKEDKLLAKLIRDTKNADYLDQLYYERALIAKKNNDLNKSKDFLTQSIEASTKNTRQKAKSHLLLAEILYDEIDYTASQENYAACLELITDEHPEFNKVSKRALVLTDLVTQLNFISKNDSLLSIADMPKDKLEAYLYDQAVANVEAAQNDRANSVKIVDQFAQNDIQKKNTEWYFYSENAKKSGFNTFKVQWGDRQLEDDWRRTNKTTGNNDIAEEKTDEEKFDEKVDALYQQLLAEVPENDEAVEALKVNVVKAHYSAANIYKYDLYNDENAIYHFNKIVKEFPKSTYDAESFYNLYLLNKETNKTASLKSKNSVLSNYPDSKYAKIIKDPSFLEKSNDKSQVVESYYEDTYLAYSKEEYEKVIKRINESKTLYPNNTLEAKFALLEAITLGKQKKYKPYVDALEGVIAEYKDTEEEEKATEMLLYLKGDFSKKPDKVSKPAKEKETEEKEEESNSIFDPNKGKDKEGFKVNFGKKEILKVGTNEEAEKEAEKNESSNESIIKKSK